MTTTSKIKEEYLSTLGDLNFNCKALINVLTILAEENKEHSEVIVDTIKTHITKVSPKNKLPVLYLIDSIIKNVGEEYLNLFSHSIVNIFCGVFHEVNEEVRQKMFALRQTWNDVFPLDKLYALDTKTIAIDPKWPITAKVASVIYVNPNFFKSKTAAPNNKMQKQLLELQLLESKIRKLDFQLNATMNTEQKKLLQLKTANVNNSLIQADNQTTPQLNGAVESSNVNFPNSQYQPVDLIQLETEPSLQRTGESVSHATTKSVRLPDPRIARQIVQNSNPRYFNQRNHVTPTCAQRFGPLSSSFVSNKPTSGFEAKNSNDLMRQSPTSSKNRKWTADLQNRSTLKISPKCPQKSNNPTKSLFVKAATNVSSESTTLDTKVTSPTNRPISKDPKKDRYKEKESNEISPSQSFENTLIETASKDIDLSVMSSLNGLSPISTTSFCSSISVTPTSAEVRKGSTEEIPLEEPALRKRKAEKIDELFSNVDIDERIQFPLYPVVFQQEILPTDWAAINVDYKAKSNLETVRDKPTEANYHFPYKSYQSKDIDLWRRHPREHIEDSQDGNDATFKMNLAQTQIQLDDDNINLERSNNLTQQIVQVHTKSKKELLKRKIDSANRTNSVNDNSGDFSSRSCDSKISKLELLSLKRVSCNDSNGQDRNGISSNDDYRSKRNHIDNLKRASTSRDRNLPKMFRGFSQEQQHRQQLNHAIDIPTIAPSINMDYLTHCVFSDVFKETKDKSKEKEKVKPISLSEPDSLKRRRQTHFQVLFSGIQCSRCGVRFSTEQTIKHNQHLDWHFQNRDRDSARRVNTRPWYYDVADWIQYEEIEDLDERENNRFETQQSETDIANDDSAQRNESPVPSCIAGMVDISEDQNKWSITLDESDVKCEDDNAVDVSMEIDPNDDAVDGILRFDDDVIVLPQEKPIITEIPDSDKAPTSTDSSIVDVKGSHEEPEDDEYNEGNGLEKATVIEDNSVDGCASTSSTSTQSQPRKAATHQTQASMITSLDGNVQLQDAPKTICTNKIKINILKKVISASENGDKQTKLPSEKGGKAVVSEPNNEEQIMFTYKATMKQINFKKMPAVGKGQEKSGLCTIM